MELSVRGPEALEALAQRVIDFDPKTFTFAAEGDVFFENADGRGTADRADSLGRTHFELTGSPSRPARFELEAGQLAADWIEYQDRSFRAEGSVRARWRAAEGEHTFESQWLELDRLEDEADPRERFELRAGGSVHAALSQTDTRVQLDSDLMEASGWLVGSGDEAQLTPTAVQATGNVEFVYSSHAPDRRIELTGSGDQLLMDGDGPGSVDRARRGERQPVGGAGGRGPRLRDDRARGRVLDRAHHRLRRARRHRRSPSCACLLRASRPARPARRCAPSPARWSPSATRCSSPTASTSVKSRTKAWAGRSTPTRRCCSGARTWCPPTARACRSTSCWHGADSAPPSTATSRPRA